MHSLHESTAARVAKRDNIVSNISRITIILPIIIIIIIFIVFLFPCTSSSIIMSSPNSSFENKLYIGPL